MTKQRLKKLPDGDFNNFFHELRSSALRSMPSGARRVLSVGCSGSWYFHWFAENYPSVRNHIGVEAYSPRPADLPAGVEWVADSAGNMTGVRDQSIDLIFAGQAIEHFWVDDAASFLCEAWRTLSPEGWLIMDSPNRRITQALNWIQHEHTVEYTVDEVVTMLRLAGFQNVNIRGIWLCYDRESHQYFPLEPDQQVPGWNWEKRLDLSSDRPEDCFAWWVEAQKSTVKPQRDSLLNFLSKVYEPVRTQTLLRFNNAIGSVSGSGRARMAHAHTGESGYLVYGPYAPIAPGKYRLTFALQLDKELPASVSQDDIFCTLDVAASAGQKIIKARSLAVKAVPPGIVNEISFPFDLTETVFGAEFRVFSTGIAGMSARLLVDLTERT
jgi:predicted SAM-dependent methyltransferase